MYHLFPIAAKHFLCSEAQSCPTHPSHCYIMTDILDREDLPEVTGQGLAKSRLNKFSEQQGEPVHKCL